MSSLVVSMAQINAIAAAAMCLPMVLFSKFMLWLWMGAAFAEHAWIVLALLALSFGLLALNITGHYALLALAQVRLVALLNLAGGAAMLIVMFLLTPRYGLLGAALGRLLYGPITLLMYPRLWALLSPAIVEPSSTVAELVSP